MSQHVAMPAVNWYVDRSGNGDPVVLLHGLGASSHSWRDIVPFLCANYDVLNLDLPGHGRSSTTQSRLSLPWIASALSDLLVHLEVKPLAFVGHSAGAAIAMRVALDGVSVPGSIISFNGAFFPFQGRANPAFRRVARFMSKRHGFSVLASRLGSNYRRVDRTLKQTGSYLSPAGVEHYRALAESTDHVAATLSMMANWHLEPLIEDAPKLPCPFWAVVGQDDEAVPPSQGQRMARMVPRGELHRMRGGHLAHEEYPKEAAQFILQKLEA